MSRTFAQCFGRRVALRRLSIGLLQENLAHRTGFDRTSIGNIERGEINVSLQDAALIAQALGCALSDLVGRRGDAKPEKRRLPGRRASAKRRLIPAQVEQRT